MSDKLVKSAVFLASFPDVSVMHDYNLPEFAFIGRSNVGKSSLINMLCNRNQLALTSSKPGKTKQIVCFKLNQHSILVDLPGYGYAKLSKTQINQLEHLNNQYLLKRQSLYCLFILIDFRLPPQAIDLEFIRYCGEKQIPIAFIMTKCDKVTPPLRAERLSLFTDAVLRIFDTLPPLFISSSTTKEGRTDILSYIHDLSKPH
jgi:GTP-binding protein